MVVRHRVDLKRFVTIDENDLNNLKPGEIDDYVFNHGAEDKDVAALLVATKHRNLLGEVVFISLDSDCEIRNRIADLYNNPKALSEGKWYITYQYEEDKGCFNEILLCETKAKKVLSQEEIKKNLTLYKGLQEYGIF